MGPEQNHDRASKATKVSTKSKASSSCGLIGYVAKLMGKTVGLAQSTGTKTAGSLMSTGRQAGKLLHVPAKLRSLVTYGAEKERKVEVQFEIERLGRRIEKLYTRIGERICHSPLFDRSLLPMDPQLEALASTVRDLESELNDLRHQDQIGEEESRSSEREASEPAGEKQSRSSERTVPEPAREKESRSSEHAVPEPASEKESPDATGTQASEPSESAPVPAPEEGEVPPSGIE